MLPPISSLRPPSSPASERDDLLTVVLHELEHMLDFEHTVQNGDTFYPTWFQNAKRRFDKSSNS